MIPHAGNQRSYSGRHRRPEPTAELAVLPPPDGLPPRPSLDQVPTVRLHPEQPRIPVPLPERPAPVPVAERPTPRLFAAFRSALRPKVAR